MARAKPLKERADAGGRGMRIGVIKEMKDRENRVALTPAGARRLAQAGHTVVVQQGAGLGSGFADMDYLDTGAKIVAVEHAWDTDLVLKVKEPLAAEYPYLRQQILFTYLHLAGAPTALTATLLQQQTTAVAYETVEDARGRLPLLAPMSAIAGNMAITVGNYYLATSHRGKGVQLGTVLGVHHGKVVIIGDGIVGQHAARAADGLGAHVFLYGKDRRKEAHLKRTLSARVHFFLYAPAHLAHHLEDADLVVGAVLLRGARAPHVVTEDMVKRMQPGSVIVDVSIDQGGCVATSRPTSHSDPIFETHGVMHYCVPNMPGAYPHTATIALTDATLPYVLRLAEQGLSALRNHAGFGKGVNTYRGYITAYPVANALGMMSRLKPFVDIAA
jgi:alanine dehydrogenase